MVGLRPAAHVPSPGRCPFQHQTGSEPCFSKEGAVRLGGPSLVYEAPFEVVTVTGGCYWVWGPGGKVLRVLSVGNAQQGAALC